MTKRAKSVPPPFPCDPIAHHLSSRNYPIRIIENIDSSRPTPKPAILRCSDGAAAVVEQVPCKKLRTPTARKPYSFKANTPGFLPVSHPFTLTFTPSSPIDPTEDSFRRGICYEVREDGRLRSFDTSPILDPSAVLTVKPKTKGPQQRSVEELGRMTKTRRVGGMPVTAVEPMQPGDPPVRVLSWLPDIPKCHDRLNATPHATPQAPIPGPSQPSGSSRDSPLRPTSVASKVSSSATNLSPSNTTTAPASLKEADVLELPASTQVEGRPSSSVTKATPSTSLRRSSKQDASTQTSGAVSTIPFPTMSSAPKTRGTFLDPNDYLPVRRSPNGPLFPQAQAGSVSSSSSASSSSRAIKPSPSGPPFSQPQAGSVSSCPDSASSSSRAVKPLPSGKGFVLGNFEVGSSSIARRLSSSSSNGKGKGKEKEKGNKRSREPENEVGQADLRPAQRPKNDDGLGLQGINPERFQAWKDAVLQVLGQQPSNPGGSVASADR